MRRLTQTVATLGLLGSIWAGLGLVAWSSGAMPERIGAEPRTETEFDPHANDSRAPDHSPIEAPALPSEPASEDETPTEGAGTTDTPSPETSPSAAADPTPDSNPASEAPSASPPIRTFTIEAPGSRVALSLVAGQLLGDDEPELIVGLSDRFEILRTAGDELERLALIRFERTEPTFIAQAPRAAIGDVTGDGVPDLVVAFWQQTEGGGSRGGGAWILRGKSDGTLDRPRRFCGPRVMATSVALMDLDGRGGLDVVISDRGRPWGEINGRLFLYSGARMPRLLREIRTEVKNVRTVLPAHLNDDERADLVVVGETVALYENQGRGRVRLMEVDPDIVNSSPRSFSGDLDGDGRLEAYVIPSGSDAGTFVIDNSGTHFLPHSASARDDDARHHFIRALRDIDGDGRAEALAYHAGDRDWSIGFFGDQGEPERLTRTEHERVPGGPIRSGYDGVILSRADGTFERVTIGMTIYDIQTQNIVWRITRTPLCIGCSAAATQEGEIRAAETSEWTVR